MNGEALAIARGICLYFVTPTENNATATTPNLLNINHIAEQPEWSEVARIRAWGMNVPMIVVV